MHGMNNIKWIENFLVL